MKLENCTPEKCGSCGLNEASRASCKMMTAIVDRMAQTPIAIRTETHKEEVTVVVYEAIRALFIVTGNVDMAINVVGNIMDEFIGKLRRAEAQSLVDKVLKDIDHARQAQPAPPGAPIETTTEKKEIVH